MKGEGTENNLVIRFYDIVCENCVVLSDFMCKNTENILCVIAVVFEPRFEVNVTETILFETYYIDTYFFFCSLLLCGFRVD